MKYVIFNQNGLLHPVLFAEHTSHAQVHVEGATPVSAGFVHFEGLLNEPKCYGRSTALNLDSRGTVDEDIIRKWQLNMPTSSFLNLEDDFTEESETF